MEPTPNISGMSQPRSPAGAQVVTAAPVAAPRSGFRGLFFLFFLFLLMLIGAAFFIFVIVALATGGNLAAPGDNLQEKFVSHNSGATDKIAIIDITGVIGDGAGVKKQIDRVRKDDDVKGVVLRVNSPGGTVTGSDYILHHLLELKKDKEDMPIVVSMGGLAASGGYYVAMAVGDTEQSIYAEPTTLTGSIGVIIPHYNISGLMDKWGIENDSITSGDMKDMLSMTKERSPEEQKVVEKAIKGIVMSSFDRFKQIVRDGRPGLAADEDRLTEVTTGEIFTAEQAKNVGLIDEIGWVEDAIDRAIDLAKLDKDNVRVVRFKKLPTIADLLLSAQQQRAQAFTPEMLLDLSTPKAYYLYSLMPPIAASAANRGDN